MDLLQIATGITKCDDYYKFWQYEVCTFISPKDFPAGILEPFVYWMQYCTIYFRIFDFDYNVLLVCYSLQFLMEPCSDLAALAWCQYKFLVQAQVLQTLDNAIHRIKIYSVDNVIGFPSAYPLDTDLSGG